MKQLMLVLLVFGLTGSACWKSDEELAERVKPSAVDEETGKPQEGTGVTEADTAGEKEVKKIDRKMTDSTDTVESVPVNVEEVPESPEASVSVETGGKSEAELWTAYNEAKTRLQTAKEASHFEGMVESLLDAAAFAEALDRPDIAVWQYNNIGYYAIVEFKRLTEYQERMDALQAMTPGEAKRLYLQETRTLVLKQMTLLERGLHYLQRAESMESELNNSERRDKIESNIRFIRWVQRFAKGAS